MKTKVTHFYTECFSIQVDNSSTLERIEMTFREPVTIKQAIKKVREYMRWIENDKADKIVGYIISSETGEILTEVRKEG